MSSSVAISSSAYRHGGVLISNILVRVMTCACEKVNTCEDSVFKKADTYEDSVCKKANSREDSAARRFNPYEDSVCKKANPCEDSVFVSCGR
jgi:hypothetical protein